MSTNPAFPRLAHSVLPAAAVPSAAAAKNSATPAASAFDLILQPCVQALSNAPASRAGETTKTADDVPAHKMSPASTEKSSSKQGRKALAEPHPSPLPQLMPIPTLSLAAVPAGAAGTSASATPSMASDAPKLSSLEGAATSATPPKDAGAKENPTIGSAIVADPRSSGETAPTLPAVTLPGLTLPIPDAPIPDAPVPDAPASDAAAKGLSPSGGAASRPQKAASPDNTKSVHAKQDAAHASAQKSAITAAVPDLTVRPGALPDISTAASPGAGGGSAHAPPLAGSAAQPGGSSAQSTAPQGAPATPVPPAAQLSHAVAALHLRSDGASQLTIRLDPEELGHIQVQIARARDGAATISVAVEKLETLHALQADLTHLHLALDRAGVAGQRSIELQLAPAQPAPDAAAGAGPAGQSGQQSGGQPGSYPGGHSAFQRASPQHTTDFSSGEREPGAFLILPQIGAPRASGRYPGINITA